MATPRLPSTAIAERSRTPLTIMTSIISRAPRIDREELISQLFEVTEQRGNAALRHEMVEFFVKMNYGRLTGTSRRSAKTAAKAAAKSLATTITAAKATAKDLWLDRVMPNGKKVRELGKRDAAKYGRELGNLGGKLLAASAALKKGEIIGNRFNESSFRKL